MQLFRSLVWRVFYTICAVIFLFALFMTLYVVPPANFTSRVNFGEVSLTVENPVLLHRWQCTPVNWSVEGIEKVYFDDQPGVGQQRVTYCPTTANNPEPLLYVDFQGEFIQTFSIPITVLTETVWFWTGVILLVVLGIPTFLPVPQPTVSMGMPRLLSRRQFLLTGAAAVVVLLGTAGIMRWRSQSTVMHDGWLLKSHEVKR